jgi:nucleotide-binding universal stress UspA family protein
MKILFCSDGSVQAENAIGFGGKIAAACRAEATILGITETAGDEAAMLQALARGQQLLKDKATSVEIIVKSGEPVEEIIKRTTESKYDLVVIGAVRKGAKGAFWLPAKAYKIIKRITPPVLTVIGARARLQNILICTAGRSYIDKAVQFTGEIAKGADAKATLVHVMAEPPRVYADLIAREEDLDRLLNSSSLLGQNLKRLKGSLEAMGVVTEVRLRHGEVMQELLREMRLAEYDLVVAGSVPGRGPLQTYIMGDITREIINQAECPVLVVRTGEVAGLPEGLSHFLAEIKQAFGRRGGA